MGLGTGIDCKYCKQQLYLDDDNRDEENKICGKCNAIKKITKEEQDERLG